MDAWRATAVSQGVQRSDFKYEVGPDLRSQLTTQTRWAKVDADGVGQPEGNETKTVYVHDHAGQLIKTIADDGRSTAQASAYSYDGLGRVRFAPTPPARSRSMNTPRRAPTTRRIKLRAANGLVTTSVYDNAGRLTSVAQSGPEGAALGSTTYSTMRSDAGHDPGRGWRRTWILYDGAGRKIADIDGDGSLTEYLYNANDQVTRVISYGTAVNTGALFDSVTSLPTCRP